MTRRGSFLRINFDWSTIKILFSHKYKVLCLRLKAKFNDIIEKLPILSGVCENSNSFWLYLNLDYSQIKFLFDRRMIGCFDTH